MRYLSPFVKSFSILILSFLFISCESFLTSPDDKSHNSVPTGPELMTSTGQTVAGSPDPVLLEQYKTPVLPEVQTFITDDLIDIINPGQPLPVIIRLAIPFTPEGLLTDQEIQQQRENIRNAQNTLLDVLATVSVTGVKKYKYIPFIAMRVDETILSILENNPLVSIVMEDEAEPPALAQSIPLIGADKAWNAGFTGEGYTLGVLDTGVDLDHPFFQNRIVDQACFSSNYEQQDVESLCPNGQEEDFGNRAGDHVSQSVAGYDHGTHVAGIAAGKGSDFSGVARQASLISVQIFSRFNDGRFCGFAGAPCALSFISDQMKALEWIYELRGSLDIAAANMSIAGGRSNNTCDNDPRKAAVDNLRSSYIATIASAGNNGFTNGLSSPACISTVISVGSTTKSDNHSTFSNSATFLDLLAPGSSINSAVPGGGFSSKSGTSMASAHVAGAWGVVRQANPSANVTEVLGILTDTGVPVTNDQNGITKPRIALNSAVGNPEITQIVYDDRLASTWINTSWSASVDFNSIEHVFSGSNSIRVQQNAWGALSLRNESWTSTVGIKHKLIEFAIYPEKEVVLDLSLENDERESFPRFRYGRIQPGHWTWISVPMSRLNPGEHTVHRINIMESSGGQKTYHIDDFQITNNDPGPAPDPEPGILAIYDESLAEPWNDASWNATIDYGNTEQTDSGSRSIRIKQNAWGGFSVRSGSWSNPDAIQPDEYMNIEFALYASGAPATIDLNLENDNGTSFPRVRHGTISPGNWTSVSIPLANLNPDGHAFHRINIMESSGQTRTFYIDKLNLKK